MSTNPANFPLLGRLLITLGGLLLFTVTLTSCNPFDMGDQEAEPTVAESAATEERVAATPTVIQLTTSPVSISAAVTATRVAPTSTPIELKSTPGVTDSPTAGTPAEATSTLTTTERPPTGTSTRATSTLTATEVPLTGTPTVTETPTEPPEIIYVVANTDGDGVNIRTATDDPESIKVWEDGTEMVVVGPDVTAEGRDWKNVRDPDGNVGFVAADFLEPQPTPEPTAIATSTPDADAEETTPTPDDPEITLYIGKTDGDGAYIRGSVDTTDRIKAWPDGTEMVVVGPAVAAGGRVWRNVRDPDGNVGFVPSEYLVDKLPTAVVETGPTATPAGTISAPTATAAVGLPNVECASPEERPYLTALLSDYERTRQSLQAFGALFNNAAADPSLLVAPSWRDNVAGHLASLRVTATKIRDLDAPDSVQNIQVHARNAAQNILSAVDLYESGLQDSNQSDLDTATGHLQTANQHASELQAELGKLCNR